MLSFACDVEGTGRRDPRVAVKLGFSLARAEAFPYNPVDFVSPVGLQVCVPEFAVFPKLKLAQEAGK
jgi:hypothetical protein